jgi:hypothetical protein
MYIFFSELEALLEDSSERVSVVVFVHGWKHTARADDGNVMRFRTLLTSLNEIEQQTGCGRRVVGLYVGWRGAGTTLDDPLENITFFTRKNAAQHVALGEVRVLFSRLRAIQDAANADWLASVTSDGAKPRTVIPGPESGPPDTCKKPMRLSIAGHSFGGLIVYTSLAQSLIRDLVDLGQAEALARRQGTAEPVLSREGDLVVVINPAIEATRFEPLYRASREFESERYHSPIFVSITSYDDQATRLAFPLGRRIGTMLEHYPADAPDTERRANIETFGQDDDYLSHDLTATAYFDAAKPDGQSDILPDPVKRTCEGWGTASDEQQQLDIEWRETTQFLSRLTTHGFDARGLYPRIFCARQMLVLSLRDGQRSANNPVWNIYTRSPVIDNHNDFDNPLLVAFFRQLYRESEIRQYQLQIH